MLMPMLPTAAQVQRFAADGVVKIARVVEPRWIDPLLELAASQLREPSRWVTDANRGAAAARVFTDRCLWREQPLVRSFVFESGVAALAGTLMRSSSTRFYFDHLLVKQPDTAEPTPWHQDIPYWPFLGRQICSVWVALTHATVEESSLEFVRGSHLWNKYFARSVRREGRMDRGLQRRGMSGHRRRARRLRHPRLRRGAGRCAGVLGLDAARCTRQRRRQLACRALDALAWR
jgi:hypothetical protein